MITTLILAMALVPETPTAPSPGQIERMTHAFERAPQVWTVTSRAGFYLTRPHASEIGLDYRKTPGYPPRRPSVIAGNWDTIPAPPRPLPWSTIQRIEWKHGGTEAGLVAGTLAGVALLAGTVALVQQSGGDVGPSAPSVVLGAVAGGALVGVLVSSFSARTQVIYRAP